MARERDEGRRRSILEAAKRLFAARGFHGASMADLAREAGIPVGSLYTYFDGKEGLVRTIVEEGWSAFHEGLAASLAAAPDASARLSLIVDTALPGLFRDLDFISIFLEEAGRGGSGLLRAGLDSKLETLASLVAGVVGELAAERGLAWEFPPRRAMAAICLFFLGSLDTVRLARGAGLPVGEEEVLAFIRQAVEGSFGVRLPPPPPSPAPSPAIRAPE